MSDNLKNAKHHVECIISELKENRFQTEMETEKNVAHAKGFISSLRHGLLIEHQDFKSMDLALDEALRKWHFKYNNELT